jgi:hypothetical protein
MDVACGKYGGGKAHKGFWQGNLRDKDHLEDIGIDGRVMLEPILKKSVGSVWTGLISHRMGTNGGLW